MGLFAPMYVIAVVCMHDAPDVCRDVVADEQVSALQCFSRAMTLGANYVSKHPGWEFLTARCTTDPPEPEGTDL